MTKAYRGYRNGRRRVAPAIITFFALVAVGGYLAATLLATAPAARHSVVVPDVAMPAAFAYAAPHAGESAVSVTGSSFAEANGILGSSGGTAAVPIASISKLITALVILEKKPLGLADAGPLITFSKADSKLYDKYYVLNASVSPMKSASSMSQSDALKVMLIASACNYAEAVSTWAYGSQSAFLAATKTWLAAHSLNSTRILEPSGIDAGNVSTPTDLIALGRLALANPLVASIVTLPSAQVANIGLIQNTNDLLGIDSVDGIKTGTLPAGSDLLFSSTMNVAGTAPLSIVGVILSGSSRETVNADARQILASIRLGFHDIAVSSQGASYGKYTTPWGDSAEVVAASSHTVLAWSATTVTSTVSMKRVVTASDGATVGTVTYTAGTATVSVPLVLKGTIGAPDSWWRVTHPFDLLG